MTGDEKLAEIKRNKQRDDDWRGDPSQVWTTAHEDRAKLLGMVERLRADSHAIGNLLAVIHGDGGHYQQEHGTAKAVEDAAAKFYALRARVAELEAPIRRRKGRVDRAG